MADTKISALTAASAAADANEIPINEAGTTKKLTVAQIITRALASLKASAANAKDTTNVSTLLTPANLLDVGAARVCFFKTGLDFNVTTDQALTKVGAFNSFIPVRAVVFNASIALSTAVGGIYSAPAKGGAAIVANTQPYANAGTQTSGGQALSFAALYGSICTFTDLYLSLTTPQGAAATADLYIIGAPIT